MSEPQYARIADKLREQLRQGVWKPGDRLPSHAELAEMYDVSVTTSRGAVLELVKENLVFTATSRGTIVRSRQVMDHVVTDALRKDRPRRATADVFVETADKNGRNVDKEFGMVIEPASVEVAGWLGIEPRAWVVTRSLVQLLDGEPWSWEVSHFPRALAEETGIDSPDDIAEGTMQRLADRGYPETSFLHIEEFRAPNRDEADRLGIAQSTWITDFVRIAATDEAITHVTRRRWVADRNRILHEIGNDPGLQLIRSALNRAKEAGEG